MTDHVTEPGTGQGQGAVLEVHGLARRFGATQALDGVDLTIAAGEVVALMGANGAGKSTLVKIVCGAVQPDRGRIVVGGQERRIAGPAAARALGIVAVHQATDAAHVGVLSIAENLVLDAICGGRLPSFLSRRRVRREAARVAGALDLALPLDAPLSSLSLADRQLVSIARALAGEARLLILDEPTASLSEAEAEHLFGVVRRLSARGVAILLVSHRTADLQRAADRAVVLRDGRVAAEFARPIDFPAALAAMVGALPAASRRDPARHALLFAAHRLQLRPDGPGLDFALHAGEIAVLFGALGAGKSRLLATLFGARRPAGGAMMLQGRPWRPRHPADAIAGGVFLAAEDRWRTSFSAPGTLGADIAGTIGLPHLPRWTGWLGLLPARQLSESALEAIRRLGIVCTGPDDRIERLSGGNQQKLVVARWTAEQARLLLLDEPFAGVDVRARHDIVASLRALGGATAVMLATSDAEEALQAADRVLVIRHDGLHAIARGEIADGAALLSFADPARDRAA